MRLPFTLGDSKIEDDARIKFSFTSPELHQNIEISLDGDDTSVEALIDAFQRFLGALGVAFPENVVLGFVDVGDEEQNDNNSDDGGEESEPNDKK